MIKHTKTEGKTFIIALVSVLIAVIGAIKL